YDLYQVASALTRENRSRLIRREDALIPQRLRQQRLRVHTVPYVFDVLAEQGVTDAFLQQIEPTKDRQTGPDQSDELLVEMDEIVGLDRLPPAGPERDRPAAGPDRDRQKALFLEPVPHFIRVLSDEHHFNHLAGRLGI